MEGIQTFKGSWHWPWPWIRPHGIPSCITHRPLPTYQISFKSKKLFVDGRTYGRTDGRTFSPSNIIRSTFGSRPKNINYAIAMQTPKFRIFSPQMPPLVKCRPGRQPSLALLPAATDNQTHANFLVLQFWPLTSWTQNHNYTSSVISTKFCYLFSIFLDLSCRKVWYTRV